MAGAGPTSSSTGPTTSSSTGPTTSSTQATLEWSAPTANIDGTPLTDLAGYRIYYGTDPESLSQSVQIADLQTTTYVIQGLSPGTWYFAIKAFTSAGTESAFSNLAAMAL